MSTSEPPAPSGPPPAPPPPPTSTPQWRSLRGLKTALTWLLTIDALATLFVIVALIQRIGTLDAIEEQGATDVLRADDEDARELIVSAIGVWGLFALATAIVFIVWFFKAAKNNEALGRERPRLGPGWAIGGWFIPIAFLVIPVLIAQDLWRGSDPSVPRGDDRWRIGPRSALVGWWWAILLVSRVSFFFGGGNSNDNRYTVSELRSGANAAIVSQLLTVAAAVLAILVVRRITERQEECLRVQQGQWTPPPPPPPPGG